MAKKAKGNWWESLGENVPFVRVVDVDPDLAQEFMKRNKSNRDYRKSLTKQYSKEMVAGRWVFNGEPLIFDKQGRLRSGQHRLMALINAKMTLPFLCVFDVMQEADLTIDTGTMKSQADIFGFHDVSNPKVVAPALSWIEFFKTKNYRKIPAAEGYELLQSEYTGLQEIVDTVVDWAKKVKEQKKPKLVHEAIWSAFIYFFNDLRGDDKASTFVNELMLNQFPAKSSSQVLFYEQTSDPEKKKIWSRGELIQMLVKAFLAWVNKEKLENIIVTDEENPLGQVWVEYGLKTEEEMAKKASKGKKGAEAESEDEGVETEQSKPKKTRKRKAAEEAA